MWLCMRSGDPDISCTAQKPSQRATRAQTSASTVNVQPHGGDYVCLSSRVIVRGSTGSLIAFNLTCYHGTTRPYLRETVAVCGASTTWIQEAYEASRCAADGMMLHPFEDGNSDINVDIDGMNGVGDSDNGDEY